jgi:YHS domain-containing protein
MKKSGFLLLIALVTISTTHTQTVKINTIEGTAIKGYDAVAYFMQQKAMPGDTSFTYNWSGSNWQFISQANLDSFKVAPEKYVPQYGGFCAYGCSANHLSPTDPNAWTIVDNNLYLNYNLKVKDLWLKDTTNLIKKADGLWPSLNK